MGSDQFSSRNARIRLEEPARTCHIDLPQFFAAKPKQASSTFQLPAAENCRSSSELSNQTDLHYESTRSRTKIGVYLTILLWEIKSGNARKIFSATTVVWRRILRRRRGPVRVPVCLWCIRNRFVVLLDVILHIKQSHRKGPGLRCSAVVARLRGQDYRRGRGGCRRAWFAKKSGCWIFLRSTCCVVVRV